MGNAAAVAPVFDRLNYYYGQLLGADDFVAEQRYFREKLKLHNRCLHGYGVVCGLEVVVPPPATPPAITPAVQVATGFAIDADGNELVVRYPIDIPDLTALLSAAERAALPATGSGVPVWITCCYQERGIEPNRPVLPDACGAAGDCLFGRTREQVCIGATTTAPAANPRCSVCCAPPADSSCLVLARIDGVLAGQTTIAASAIHNEVRKVLGLHPTTTINGIGWTQGGTYSVADAKTMLGMGGGGLTFRFSGPVYESETTPQGIVDAWLLKSSGDVVYVQGGLSWTAAPPPAPAGTALSVTFQSSAPAAVQPESNDRVLITLRAAFLLDACCRPVYGAHAGGRVPALSGALVDPNVQPPASCVSPPGGFGGWTSGGSSGTSFESWFFVQ
jgi:hypothetical protein